MRTLLFGIALTLCGWTAATASQQKHIHMKGRVVDAATGRGLPGAHVFVDGTTMGTTTTDSGEYTLPIAAGRPEYTILASRVGYETQSRTVDAASIGSDETDFTLKEATYELESVEVTASIDEWQERLALFEEYVFGLTNFSEYCTISNPEYLNLSTNPESNILTASSSRPFRFVNRALGYRIAVHDFRFTGSYMMFRWEGAMTFEELSPNEDSDTETWQKNRRIAYEGSFRHFLASLVNDRTYQEGFIMTPVHQSGIVPENIYAANPKKFIDLAVADSAIPTWSLSMDGVLLITYRRETESMRYRAFKDKFGLRPRDRFEERTGRLVPRESQHSWLRLNRLSILVDRAGNEYGRYGLERSGYWAWERMCEQLPTDYVPDNER